MDLGLKNKNVVVTGGSRGIGFAVAREFLKEGARVTITGRDTIRLTEAVQELQQFGEIYATAGDGTSEQDVREATWQAAEGIGKIDVWVNNVGKNRRKH